MDFLYVLVFIVVGIFSMAQKFQEARQKGESRRAQQNKSKPGEVPGATRQRMMKGADVQVAKAKGVAQRARNTAASPEATGKELIEALFGEGASESDDGWEEVHPEHRPVAKRAQSAIPQHQDPEHARAAALKQREDMEHDRSRKHRIHGEHEATSAARAKAEEELKRQQVLAERERRKQAAEAQRHEASRKRHQRKAQSRVRGIVAPVGGSGGVIPRNLVEVRRGIVMSEILGKPKAFK
jgi:hypothetical protein